MTIVNIIRTTPGGQAKRDPVLAEHFLRGKRGLQNSTLSSASHYFHLLPRCEHTSGAMWIKVLTLLGGTCLVVLAAEEAAKDPAAEVSPAEGTEEEDQRDKRMLPHYFLNGWNAMAWREGSGAPFYRQLISRPGLPPLQYYGRPRNHALLSPDSFDFYYAHPYFYDMDSPSFPVTRAQMQSYCSANFGPGLSTGAPGFGQAGQGSAAGFPPGSSSSGFAGVSGSFPSDDKGQSAGGFPSGTGSVSDSSAGPSFLNPTFQRPGGFPGGSPGFNVPPSFGPGRPGSSSFGSDGFGSPGSPSSGFGAPGSPGSSFGSPGSPGSSFGSPGSSGSSFGSPGSPGSSFGSPGSPGSSFGSPGSPGSSFGSPGSPGSSFGSPGSPGSSFGSPGSPGSSFGSSGSSGSSSFGSSGSSGSSSFGSSGSSGSSSFGSNGLPALASVQMGIQVLASAHLGLQVLLASVLLVHLDLLALTPLGLLVSDRLGHQARPASVPVDRPASVPVDRPASFLQWNVPDSVSSDGPPFNQVPVVDLLIVVRRIRWSRQYKDK
ncbi:collagen alpha-1(III) chain-like [Penaeus chinensis]|uniref:collagen alpha-1(III) chain-like n=1 Tax=Penaeus chinensis TaxID=139456 RepID=UPI001FB647F9|nr:collagen alpha-1(III) chain-like [Penaeus chinensis]